MADIQLKDVIHLYLGCDCKHVSLVSDVFQLTAVQSNSDQAVIRNHKDRRRGEYTSVENVRPILRKPEDMTDDEWLICFQLSRGIVDQSYVTNKIQRLSTSERMIVLGKSQYVFGYHNCCDNDVRLGYGICFYLHSYLIEDNISVSAAGIEEKESWYNRKTVEQVLNVTHIILYLLNKGFDLFNLVPSGQAIDKTTLKQ